MRLTKLLNWNILLNSPHFSNHFSCGYETYRICTIEDGEHFGEIGLRLTPRLGMTLSMPSKR